MKNRLGSFFVLTLLLLLAGCASVTQQPSATSTPSNALPQQPGEGVTLEPVPIAAMSSNRAVIALLDRAQLDKDNGRREAAGASLERALRIEPRNPWLWHELAQLRLDQGQYAQTITLARKSNSFSGRQSRLQSENWMVIGQAHVAQGDSTGAEQAFKLAAEFAQQDKAETARDSGFGLH